MTLSHPHPQFLDRFNTVLSNLFKPSQKVVPQQSHLSYEKLFLQLVWEDVRATGIFNYPNFVDSLSLVKPKVETVSQKDYERNLLSLVIEDVNRTGIFPYPPLQKWLNKVSIMHSDLEKSLGDINYGVDILTRLMSDPSDDIFNKIGEPFNRLTGGIYRLDSLLETVSNYKVDSKGKHQKSWRSKLMRAVTTGRAIAKAQDRMKSLNCLMIGHYKKLMIQPQNVQLQQTTLYYLIEIKVNSIQWAAVIREELNSHNI
jgi:hypothetical protein